MKEKGVYIYTCKIDPTGKKSPVKKADMKIKDIVDLDIVGCKNGFIYMDKKDNCALRYKNLALDENKVIKKDYGYPAEGVKGRVFHKRDLPFHYTKFGKWLWLRSYDSEKGYEIVEL